MSHPVRSRPPSVASPSKSALSLVALLPLSLLLAACGEQSAQNGVSDTPAALRALAASTPTATFATSSVNADGFTGTVTLSNPTAAAIKGWTLKFKLGGGAAATGTPWGAGGAMSTDQGGTVSITPNTWGGDTLPAGGSVLVSYGGVGTFSGVNSCTLNGAACDGGTVNPPPPPPPAPTSVKAGSSYALGVLTPGFINRYLRHQNSLGYTEVVDASSPDLLKLDSSWKAAAGLADPSCFSFESANVAGNYLRHQGGRLRIDPNDNSALFKADATFCLRAALNGSAGNGVSLEAKNFPGSFVRHRSGEVWLDANDGSAVFKQDASWNPVAPFAPGTVPPVNPPPSGYKRVAYFAQWGIYSRNYLVKNIDTSGTAATLTHINYAFGNVYNEGGAYRCNIVTRAETGNGDGGDGFADYGKSFDAASSVDGVADVWSQPLKGNFNQLRKLKAKYPALKALISIGGWTWSRNFSAAASSDASRKALVSSCIDLYIRGTLPVSSDGAGGAAAAAGVFDGIDIDWEYPGGGGLPTNGVSAADKQNFTLLLQEFRRQLDAVRPGLLLTIAAPAGADKIANQDPAGYKGAVDWVNLMSYDFRGAWDASGPTNFHSNLYTSPQDPGTGVVRNYSVDTAVQAFLNAGMPASKLVVGVPFYGRGWTGVAGGNNGLYQSASGAAHGTYEAGIEDYKVLKNAPGTVYRDPVTKQMWKYDGSNFWSYDDPEVIAAKMAYIRAKGLGGAMAWALDGDDAQGTLAKAVASGLK